jgi:hypothetical protein
MFPKIRLDAENVSELKHIFERIYLPLPARYCTVSNKQCIKFIHLFSIHPSSSIQKLLMSFSESTTVPTRRKRTITLSEHITENGDPLVVKKKAREAASATKKTTQVFLFLDKKIKKTYYIISESNG